MIDRINNYIRMLKSGASDEKLNGSIIGDLIEDFAYRFEGIKRRGYTNLDELYKFLIWKDIPKDNLKKSRDDIELTLSNVVFCIDKYSSWRGYGIRTRFPVVLDRVVYLYCSPEDTYDFLLRINDSMSDYIKEVEVYRQRIVQKMKKTIEEVRLEYQKKQKLISINITTIESVIREMLKDLGEENIWFEHKKYVSHAYVELLDGKQQIDIYIKHSEFQSMLPTINQQVHQLAKLISPKLTVRSVTRRKYR